MTRLLCFAGVVTAVLALGSVVSGQEPNTRPVPMLNGSPQSGAGVYLLGGGSGSPAYPMLQMEQVQKELGLTPEQKEKLKEIAKKTAASQEPRLDWTKLRDMKPEERLKAQKEMLDRYAKRAEEAKKQVEQILTPKQIEKLKDIEFRQRAAGMLYMPQVLEQIELTDDQKQQVQKIREETQSKMARLQRESQDKTLKVLTPEQTKKLKELSEEGVFRVGTDNE